MFLVTSSKGLLASVSGFIPDLCTETKETLIKISYLIFEILKILTQKCITQNIKIIIQQAQNIALSHFVGFSFPTQSFIKPWIIIGSNVKWLPMMIFPRSFCHWYYAQFIQVIIIQPFLRVWYSMTYWANMFMKPHCFLWFIHFE